MGQHRSPPPAHDFSIKYDGNAYGFTVVVNTAEPIEDVADRLSKAAAGQNRNAAVVGGYKVERAELEKIFAAAGFAAKRHGQA